jgi:hypothetical protein
MSLRKSVHICGSKQGGDATQAARRSERGQSLMELALSFTILVLLLAVAVDMGRMFFAYIAVREAAEEGAIYGSFNPGDTGGIEARTRGSSSTPVDLANTGLVAVNVAHMGDACAGNGLQVTVTYSFNLSMPLIGMVLGTQNFPLAATATSTVLAPPCP